MLFKKSLSTKIEDISYGNLGKDFVEIVKIRDGVDQADKILTTFEHYSKNSTSFEEFIRAYSKLDTLIDEGKDIKINGSTLLNLFSVYYIEGLARFDEIPEYHVNNLDHVIKAMSRCGYTKWANIDELVESIKNKKKKNVFKPDVYPYTYTT